MNLIESYRVVKQAIVAFTPKYIPKEGHIFHPPIFPIFGTGFIVRQDGVVLTNKHVVDAFSKMPRPPGAKDDDWCVLADYYHETERGILKIPIDVIATGQPIKFKHPAEYYGPALPDLSFVRIKAVDLPSVELADTPVEEGMAVATAGFPMGIQMLTAPGWLHQIGPTLQAGVVSAVLPFPCDSPHAIALNIMVQGGASGSPVFDPETARIVGMISDGLYDVLSDDNVSYRVPINISWAVSLSHLRIAMKALDTIPAIPDGTPSLAELIQRGVREPKGR